MKKKKRILILCVIAAVICIITVQGLYTAGINFAGPLKQLGIQKIKDMYDPAKRSGEIVFYGASNFTRWKTMEEDIPAYKVQNHGFGGSNDQNLIDFAPELLYPYKPQIIVFQTGSNDYTAAEGSDSEKIQFCMERKKKMFALFHEQLPDAQMIVLSGLYLPGRSEYYDLTKEINKQLEELCAESDYLTYVNVEALTYQNGAFDTGMFVKDGIHLTDEARRIWANTYIIPAIDAVVEQIGADSLKR